MTLAMPPAFDAATYRAENAELASLSHAAAAAHYDREGRAAGRIASPLARREGLLALLADAPDVLEIGPFCSPLLIGPGVEYLDVLDSAQLRARAEKIGIDPARCPALIHHVGDLAQVDRRFAAVVSSHAIEHQPDLVRHLREIERILDSDGAMYLIVPDKRYCFDHFLPETSIAQILQAWSEGRRHHAMQSVVEHMALTTHNDAIRHWAGDHGDPERGRIERVTAAVDRFQRAEGGYVDVHAWQFTPASFRRLIDQLAALGMIGLEVAEVYDTPRDRQEFCAVLRLNDAARAAKRAAGSSTELVVLQTSDPIRYAPMLAVTQPNVAAFCQRHGFVYEAFVGISRGFHAWQATYNRIPLLQTLLDRGYRGWALYLDADAYIADPDFDLAAYLDRHRDRAAIFATSGVTDARWDVNCGVAFVNLGHPQGRRLIEGWSAKFAAIDDARLRAAEQWINADNDQDLMHQLLREDAAIGDAVAVESMDLINSRHARFIRQHLRAQTGDVAARTRAIAEELNPGGDVARTGLMHGIAVAPPLAVAEPREPLARALVERTVDYWRSNPLSDVPPHQAALAALLDAGDRDALAAMLADLGGQAASQGVLGGARQRARATDAAFARKLAVSTYDRLVSLAEAVGAFDLENPEAGPWGEAGARDPGALFAAIEHMLDADLAPPSRIGGYLGITVRPGVVLHSRLIEAIYVAWRIRTLGAQHGLTEAVEIGSGVGLIAFYAARLGVRGYRIVAPPIAGVMQAAVTGDTAALSTTLPEQFDLLLNQDSLPEMPQEEAVALLSTARERGARLLLSLNPDGREAIGGRAQTPVRDLVAAAGGWRAGGRHRHWLRAGHVEEIWLAE